MFEVPAPKRSMKQNLFQFKMPGDEKVYELPKLQYLKPSLVDKLDGGQKIEVIRGITDEYIPGLFDQFDDSEQLIALYEAWAKESGISLGESSGSAESSPSMAEPSGETSS